MYPSSVSESLSVIYNLLLSSSNLLFIFFSILEFIVLFLKYSFFPEISYLLIY